PFEAEVRYAGGVEDAHAADVAPRGLGLGREEDRVAIGELLHGGGRHWGCSQGFGGGRGKYRLSFLESIYLLKWTNNFLIAITVRMNENIGTNPKQPPMPRMKKKNSNLEAARSRMYHDLIFECAERVFAEKGFDESTMQDVAAEAGISLKTLYATFPGKNEI